MLELCPVLIASLNDQGRDSRRDKTRRVVDIQTFYVENRQLAPCAYEVVYVGVPLQSPLEQNC